MHVTSTAVAQPRQMVNWHRAGCLHVNKKSFRVINLGKSKSHSQSGCDAANTSVYGKAAMVEVQAHISQSRNTV